LHALLIANISLCTVNYKFLFSVPPNAKGKTWGPSTVHQKERGQIIPTTVESPKRWSNSAPDLEKSPKALSIPAPGALQDIGNSFYDIFTSSLPASRKLKLFTSVFATHAAARYQQYVLCMCKLILLCFVCVVLSRLNAAN